MKKFSFAERKKCRGEWRERTPHLATGFRGRVGKGEGDRHYQKIILHIYVYISYPKEDKYKNLSQNIRKEIV